VVSAIVLVHGGMHTPWHWHLLEEHLRELGHSPLPVAVPMHDVDAGARTWAEVTAAAMQRAGVGEGATVVGHSLAGLMLPVLAARMPVRRLVFLAALIPTPNVPFVEYLSDHPGAVSTPFERFNHDKSTGLVTASWELAREIFYHDVPEPLAREAHRRCVPVAMTAYDEPAPFERWPDVESRYVLCEDDRAVDHRWARSASREQLNTEPVMVPTSHSPFLADPALLARELDVLLSDA
jgi:hypothetical protein